MMADQKIRAWAFVFFIPVLFLSGCQTLEMAKKDLALFRDFVVQQTQTQPQTAASPQTSSVPEPVQQTRSADPEARIAPMPLPTPAKPVKEKAPNVARATPPLPPRKPVIKEPEVIEVVHTSETELRTEEITEVAPVETAMAIPVTSRIAEDDPLFGMTGAEIRHMLGTPHLQRRDPPAEIWHYESLSCVLDLYFYDVVKTADSLVVSDYEIRQPLDSSPLARTTADVRDCLRRMAGN